jgi:hypothetical protein
MAVEAILALRRPTVIYRRGRSKLGGAVRLARDAAIVLDSFSWLANGIVAVITIIASFLIHLIYPVPQNRDYYAETTHAMWLPAERSS